MDDIAAKLDELSELQSAADLTRLDYEAKRAEILRSVQSELDSLAVEYEPLLDNVEGRIQNLQEEIKRAVIARGETVRGLRLLAVYTKGRVTWDTKHLDTYAEHNPEILRFRKQGMPSASIRVRD